MRAAVSTPSSWADDSVACPPSRSSWRAVPAAASPTWSITWSAWSNPLRRRLKDSTDSAHSRNDALALLAVCSSSILVSDRMPPNSPKRPRATAAAALPTPRNTTWNRSAMVVIRTNSLPSRTRAPATASITPVHWFSARAAETAKRPSSRNGGAKTLSNTTPRARVTGDTASNAGRNVRLTTRPNASNAGRNVRLTTRPNASNAGRVTRLMMPPTARSALPSVASKVFARPTSASPSTAAALRASAANADLASLRAVAPVPSSDWRNDCNRRCSGGPTILLRSCHAATVTLTTVEDTAVSTGCRVLSATLTSPRPGTSVFSATPAKWANP